MSEHPWIKRGPYSGLEHTGMPIPDDPVVGHKTYHDGHHEPLRQSESAIRMTEDPHSLIARLREHADWHYRYGAQASVNLLRAAADQIEADAARIAQLEGSAQETPDEQADLETHLLKIQARRGLEDDPPIVAGPNVTGPSGQ